MTRNILIIGITGSGKSALANVLTNADQFEEGSSIISVTKNYQKSDPFEWKGTNYYVIDNIGFGDTDNLAEEVILYEIGKGIYCAKEGIDQVFFVFKNKFSPEQIRNFNSFKELISESSITKFTTLVRTNFVSFRSPRKCEKDRQDLLNENRELREIIESCNGILYVDNPPIPVIDEEDDEEEKKDKEKEMTINKKDREDSRELTLNHLTTNCQGVYKLKEWDNIYAIVANYFEKEKEIEQSNSLTKKEEIEKEKSKAIAEIKIKLEKEFPRINEQLTAAIEQSKR